MSYHDFLRIARPPNGHRVLHKDDIMGPVRMLIRIHAPGILTVVHVCFNCSWNPASVGHMLLLLHGPRFVTQFLGRRVWS